MKKFFFLCMAVVAMTACSDDSSTEGGGNNGGGQTTQVSLAVSPTNVDFSTDGGTSKVTITSSAAWTAEFVNDRANDWCSIDSTSGSAGTSTLTITATANDTPDDRTASVIIKAGTASKTVKVSQKQKDALTVTSSKFEVAAKGGEVVVEVKANIDFEYVVDDAAKEWISYEGTRAIQTSTLVFKITANDDTEKREGKITIKSGEFNETVNIYQAGSAPSIVISQNEYVVSALGGTIAVEVKSNVDVSIEIPQDANWIKENTTRGVSTNTYYFDISENVDYDQRSAEIKFTNKENNLSEVVKIVQVQKDAILVADSKYEFGANGGQLDFDVQANVEFKVNVYPDDCEWVKLVETRALETKTLHFDISTCDIEEHRTAVIHMYGGKASQRITINQDGMMEILEHERDVLITLYNATDGDNWQYNRNWCSDKPVSEWQGVTTDSRGRVTHLKLNDRKLSGQIPDCIGDLLQLQVLDLASNELTGSIPASVGNLINLDWLRLDCNDLSGLIPESIGNLIKLDKLDLFSNQLTGPLPATIGNLEALTRLRVDTNDISGPIPESLGNLKALEVLCLNEINIDGPIPECIGNLDALVELNLSSSNLTGPIPECITNLPALRYLMLSNNQLTGPIPESIGKLFNLSTFRIDNNKLTGSIPEGLGNLKNIGAGFISTPAYLEFSIAKNGLSGTVPKSVQAHDLWPEIWPDIIDQDSTLGGGILEEGLEIYAPQFDEVDVYGNVINNSIFQDNEYTVLFNFAYWCPWSDAFTPQLKQMYDAYKDQGLEVIAYTTEYLGTGDDINTTIEYIQKHNTTWPTIFRMNLPHRIYYEAVPRVSVFDKNGMMVFNPFFHTYQELADFLAEKFGPIELEGYYTSSDYSKDGEVKTLQTATEGNGIDIVLMGDAYSDRLIADGTYDKAMNTAMEKFFDVEPYKSFRDHFNVYSVTAVSANELYAESTSTVFNGYFGEGTYVGGDDQVVFTYAQKAISADRIDDALIVVMMNSINYAGTCYMYGPSEGDWGDGASVSYFPVGADAAALARVLHHEAGGHGFSKLGDEYAYESQGTIPGSEISDAQNLSTYGWWKNVDFTNDPTQVKWYHFLTDSRYSNEGLGIYEGAFTYWTGAYRPTENSIMNTNVGGFNAPSREAIYYRIHKLAYGADWEYDYEEFVEWDAKNRTTAATTRGIPYRLDIPEDFKPLHPPVVVNDSWRNAKNNAPKKATTSNGGNEGGNLRPASLNRSNLQTMSISPNRTVSSSGMVVITNPATNRRITSKPTE